MKQIDLIIDALLVAESSVWSDKIAEALAAARELRALKPVAWMLPDYGDVLSASEADGTGIYNIPLYTAPPKREWVGLTVEDIRLMAHNDDKGDWSDLRLKSCWHEGYVYGVNAAIAKLKELNT